MEGFRRKTTKCQLNRNSILKQHYYIENNNSETDDPPEFPMLTDDINIDNRQFVHVGGHLLDKQHEDQQKKQHDIVEMNEFPQFNPSIKNPTLDDIFNQYVSRFSEMKTSFKEQNRDQVDKKKNENIDKNIRGKRVGFAGKKQRDEDVFIPIETPEPIKQIKKGGFKTTEKQQKKGGFKQN